MDSWLNVLCCFYAEKYRIVHGAQENMEQREECHCQEQSAPRQNGASGPNIAGLSPSWRSA